MNHGPGSITADSDRAGGLSEGLRQAGFDPRVAVDFDRNALQTYKANHPETEIILKDIAAVTGHELMKLARSRDTLSTI